MAGVVGAISRSRWPRESRLKAAPTLPSARSHKLFASGVWRERVIPLLVLYRIDFNPRGRGQSNDSRAMMTRTIDRYTYRVTWSEEDQDYVGLCAEFPSLSWLADEPQAAFTGIRSLVRKVVDDLTRNKEAVPEPISIRRFSGKFMVRVPPEVHRKLTLQAAESGVSLNRLISSQLSRYLQ